MGNAHIIVNTALAEMARTSGASIGEILDAILADPAGNAARRFRRYIELGTAALAA